MLKKLTFVFLATALAVLAADQFVGTWKVNLAKSKYSPGPAPKSVTFTYTQDGDWIVGKNETVGADGKTAAATNRYKRDGKEYPFANSDGSKGAIVSKIIDTNTTEATLKSGTATTVLRNVMARDGKSFTRTTKGTNAQGQKVDNLIVFERQ